MRTILKCFARLSIYDVILVGLCIGGMFSWMQWFRFPSGRNEHDELCGIGVALGLYKKLLTAC